MTPLFDNHDRVARYLRLSVTDRCNLRCSYCRSGAETFIPHTGILRYEEMQTLVSLAVDMGIHKVRVTGGEPFARKGLVPFLESLRSAHANLDIRLTTNGTLVGPYISALRDLGVNAVNVSIDTFDPARYAVTTGRDLLPRVLENIDAMQSAGLLVKLNAVAMRGVNSEELPTFLAFAQSHKLDIRFIEFMPMGTGTRWDDTLFWPASAILAAARALVTLTPVERNTENAGPARMYSIGEGGSGNGGSGEGGSGNGGSGNGGRLGLITPLTSHFCAECNRLRVTSDGRLRTCLFDDREFRLRNVLRHPKLGARFVERIIRAATRQKPIGAEILKLRKKEVAQRRMTAIGG